MNAIDLSISLQEFTLNGEKGDRQMFSLLAELARIRNSLFYSLLL